MLLSRSWLPMMFSLYVSFACCIFAVGLTRSGVLAQKDRFENCSTNLATRLQNLPEACSQPDYFVRRVELCDDGVWKRTVCDDLWTTQDAVVVCREAGYTTPGAVALYLDQASVVSDTASVVLQCEGSESNISQCTIKLKSANVSCTQDNNNTIAVVACPMSSSSPTFNISSCLNTLLLALDTDPAINATTEPRRDTSTTAANQATTSSTPSDANTTSSSSVDTSTDTEGTSTDGATSAPSNGLNLTIIYAAAGAAGGVIVLILVVAVLLVVIAARRRKISPGSPMRGHKQNNTKDANEIGAGSSSLNNADISAGPAKHTIELGDQPIYEMLKDSKEEGSPSTSLKSGTEEVIPVYAQLEGDQHYAQIQPHINSPPPHDAQKPTDSHYQSLNHSMSLTRNTPASYKPQFVNKTAMAIANGLATEADVRSPDSTYSQNSSPERFKRALESVENHQPTLDSSVNHSVEDLESLVSTSAVVNQKVVPESGGGGGHLYAVLETPHGYSPQLPPRMSHSLPRSTPSNKNHDSRSNSMSRLKSADHSPKNLRSAAKNSSPRSPKNKMSSSHGSPKFSRGTHSPYTQRASLNTSRSSGLSSNTSGSGSGSTEGIVNTHHGDDGARMNTLV